MKRELADALAPTSQFAVRLAELGDPGFIAPATTGNASERNRGAQMHATMMHAASVVQVASYHIYLARYERTRHYYYGDC